MAEAESGKVDSVKKESFTKCMINDKEQVLDLEKDYFYNVDKGRKTPAGLEA